MCFNKMRNYTIRPGNLSRTVSSVVYHNNDLKLPGPATSLVLGSKQEIVVRKSSQNLEGKRKVVQDQPVFVQYLQNNYPELMGGSSRGGSSGSSGGGSGSGSGGSGRGYVDSVYGSNGSSVYGSTNVANIGVQTNRGVNVGTETDNRYLDNHYAMQQALGQEIVELQNLRNTDATAYQNAFLRLTEWLGVNTLAVRGQLEQLARGQIGVEEFHDGIHELYNEGILGAIDERAAMRRTFLENLPSIPDTDSVMSGLLSAVGSSVYSAIAPTVLSNLNRQLQEILIDSGVSRPSGSSSNSYMSREATALLENERQRNAEGGGVFVPFVGPPGFVASGLFDPSSSSGPSERSSSTDSHQSQQLGMGNVGLGRGAIMYNRGLRSTSPSLYENDDDHVDLHHRQFPTIPRYNEETDAIYNPITNTIVEHRRPSVDRQIPYGEPQTNNVISNIPRPRIIPTDVPNQFVVPTSAGVFIPSNESAPMYGYPIGRGLPLPRGQFQPGHGNPSFASSIQSSAASAAGGVAGEVGADIGTPLGVAAGSGAGGIIGGLIGGPTGAVVGSSIGSSVGGSIGNSLGRSVGSSVGRGTVNVVGTTILGNPAPGIRERINNLTASGNAAVRRSTRTRNPVARPNMVQIPRGSQSGSSSGPASDSSSRDRTYRP